MTRGGGQVKTWKCGFPICREKSSESRAELAKAGWVFRKIGGVLTGFCRLHADVQPLFKD